MALVLDSAILAALYLGPTNRDDLSRDDASELPVAAESDQATVSAATSDHIPQSSLEESAAAVRPPEVIIRPGVVSSQNAALVVRKTFAAIAANEGKLGLAVRPAGIVKVQLLDKGENFTFHDGGSMSPNDGPGWMVEAVGTFVEDGSQPGTVYVGTHGYYRWDDAGSEGSSFAECWRGELSRAEIVWLPVFNVPRNVDGGHPGSAPATDWRLLSEPWASRSSPGRP